MTWPSLSDCDVSIWGPWWGICKWNNRNSQWYQWYTLKKKPITFPILQFHEKADLLSRMIWHPAQRTDRVLRWTILYFWYPAPGTITNIFLIVQGLSDHCEDSNHTLLVSLVANYNHWGKTILLKKNQLTSQVKITIITVTFGVTTPSVGTTTPTTVVSTRDPSKITQ